METSRREPRRNGATRHTAPSLATVLPVDVCVSLTVYGAPVDAFVVR